VRLASTFGHPPLLALLTLCKPDGPGGLDCFYCSASSVISALNGIFWSFARYLLVIPKKSTRKGYYRRCYLLFIKFSVLSCGVHFVHTIDSKYNFLSFNRIVNRDIFNIYDMTLLVRLQNNECIALNEKDQDGSPIRTTQSSQALLALS
jgi:hypothetical protein